MTNEPSGEASATIAREKFWREYAARITHERDLLAIAYIEAVAIANEAMRVGLAECDALRREDAALRAMRAESDYDRAAEIAQHIANAVRLGMDTPKAWAARIETALRDALMSAIEKAHRTEMIYILPTEELLQVIAGDNRSELFVAGSADLSNVTLHRLDAPAVIVPLDWFVALPEGPKPDPENFSITDYGQTVRLGDYEASNHSILYDFDKKYRSNAKKKRAK